MYANAKLRVLIGIAALALLAEIARAEIVVIVASDNPVRELSNQEVADIFLGETDHFPGGSRAEPIDQVESSADRMAFYETVIRLSPVQLRMHWSKQIFTGRAYPPRQLGDAQTVRAAVSRNPRAIGYLDSRYVDDSVRVVARTAPLAGAPDTQ